MRPWVGLLSEMVFVWVMISEMQMDRKLLIHIDIVV